MVVVAAAAAAVWGPDLLRFGSDAAEELRFALRPGGRSADADVAEPVERLSGVSLLDASGAKQSF